MILHGKDLIVSIDGNANMASKSCTLSVSAKSIVKTSPTSGDWEEVLSGKKSWSLTTNHLVKEATEGPTHEGTLSTAKYLFENSKEGWAARGKFSTLGRSAAFDDFGADSGVTVLEVTKKASIIKKHTFTDETPLIRYLKGESSVDGTAITSDGIVALLFVGSFQIGSDTCDVLTNTFHVSLPFISYSGQSPIIIVGGKTLDYGYVSLDDINNEVIVNLTYGDQDIIPDGIPGAIEMVGKTVSVRMTDEHGSEWAGQAIVKQFKVTGTKGNLMAGSFAFTGNGKLQTNAKQSTPTAPEKIVDRIIIDMSKSNPTEMITGDINGSVFQSIMSGLGRYLGKYQGNGAMSIIHLDDNNSLKYYGGGETATLDGTQGDVFVCIRNTTAGRYGPMYIGFYYSILYLDENRIMFSVSKSSLQGYKYWSYKTLIGAFKAQATTSYNNSTLAGSGEDYYVRSILSNANAKTDSYTGFTTQMQKMNSTYFSKVGPEEHAVIALLAMMKYGTTNLKSVCGRGITNGYNTGATAMLGLRDTTPVNDGLGVNLFGLENWWNGHEEWMDRIEVSGDAWTITHPDGTTTTTHASANSPSVIQKIAVGTDKLYMVPSGDMAPIQNYSQYFCDQIYLRTNVVNNRVIRAGNVRSTQSIGPFYMDTYDPDYSQAGISTRLCFHADTITEEYQYEYESLTAVDPAN